MIDSSPTQTGASSPAAIERARDVWPRDSLDALVQDLWDNGKDLDWDEWRQRINDYASEARAAAWKEACSEAQEAVRAHFHMSAEEMEDEVCAIDVCDSIVEHFLALATPAPSATCEHHWIGGNDGVWCTKCNEEIVAHSLGIPATPAPSARPHDYHGVCTVCGCTYGPSSPTWCPGETAPSEGK